MPQPSASSPTSVLQTLAWLRKQGFKPVALAPQSKAAIDRRFIDPDYDPPPDEFWKRGNYGVGVVTGPRAKGPIDVDLDCKEAVFFAGRFLPATPAVFGRASKPKSHYLYRTTAGELDKRAYLDPLEKATIVEIRGDGGHQTVMPGSIHQDTGELIQWSDLAFPEVTTVDEELLARGVRKIAIATLIVRHVWMEGQRNEVTLPLSGLFYYLDWTLEETRALFEAVMDFTGDDDKTRLKTVALTYVKGEKGGKVSGATRLRRMLQNDVLVDRLLDLAGSPTVNLLQEYNERYAVVNVEGRFRIVDTDVPRAEPPQFMQKDDFLNLTSVDTVQVEDKVLQKAKLWLASPRRRAYKSVDFLPGLEDSGTILNLWTSWAVDPDPAASCAGWLELLRTYICGGDEALNHWMLQWFANIIREPRSKPLTAPVIMSKPGGGKALLFDYFGRILGPAYVHITDAEHIYGKFNRHLSSCLLLHSDEALYGGDLRHRGIIKSLITDEYRMFEQKGIDAKQVRNYLRLALTSNNANAAPLEADDRRFTVIDMGERKVKTNPKLVAQILAEKRGTGPAALLHFLRGIKYDSELIKENIKGEASANLNSVNFTPMEEWWYDVLQDGQLLPDYLAWAQRPARTPWAEMVGSPAMYMAMVLKLRGRGARSIPNPTTWALNLNKMLGMKLQREQRIFSNPLSDDAPREVKELSDRQKAILNLPSLSQCREAFILYTGQPVDWTGDLPDSEKPPNEKY